VPDEFLEWVAGFFDGEGTIKSHCRESPTHTIGYSINPQVTLTHRYIGGMFDAEGCIKTGPVKTDDVAIGYHAFVQSVISNNDKPLIEGLQKWADEIGIDAKVYRNKQGKWDDTFTFQIQRIDDVEIFLETLQPYLIVKQRQCDIMLNDVIPLIKNGAHLRKEGFLEVMYHVDRINENKGGNRGDYTLDYFEDLWGMERNEKDWFE